MPTRLFCSHRHLGPALRTVGVVVVIAFLSVLSSAALGANPAEEMAKMGTTDPKGNSWLSIQNSIEQFGHPEFILRLFLSLSLAVGCAWAIAWHPRRSSLANPLADLEERKALILLGLRQSENHWESHHGRGRWACLWHGIVGDGGLCYPLHLATRLLA